MSADNLGNAIGMATSLMQQLDMLHGLAGDCCGALLKYRSSAPSASDNIDYTAAIRSELVAWRDRQGLYGAIDGTMVDQLADRLNAAVKKLHCV